MRFKVLLAFILGIGLAIGGGALALQEFDDGILGVLRERGIRDRDLNEAQDAYITGNWSFDDTITVTNGSSSSSLGAAFLAINTTTARASGTLWIDYNGNIHSSGTLWRMNAANAIVSSTHGRFGGNLNVSSSLFVRDAVTFTGLVSCNTIDTDANGLLSCGTDSGSTGAIFNPADDDWRLIGSNGGIRLTTTTFQVLLGDGTATSTPFTLEVIGSAMVSPRLEVTYISATSTATSSQFYGGLLSTASSTFQSGLNVNNVLNASSTALIQTLVGYASSSFQNDLTVSGDLLASSTLQATGIGIFNNGLLSIASSTFQSTLGVNGVFNASSTALVQTLVGYVSSSFQADLTVSGDLLASSTLQASGLTTLFGGLISTASSSFAGDVTVGNLMSSGTVALGPRGYQIAQPLKTAGITIASATTTDMIAMKTFDRASTIRGIHTIVGCPNGCQGGAGIRFNLRHGTSFVPASTTAATVFDNDVIAYSSSTILSFCAANTLDTACTLSPTFNDLTLAASEILWFDASSTSGSASTTAMDLSITIFYDEQ